MKSLVIGLCVVLACALVDVADAAAEEGRPLSGGMFVGYFDFDTISNMKDFGLFGARLAAELSPWLSVEGSFEEVYTKRVASGNAARQVSFGLHARLEPLEWRARPYVLAGMAFVMFDDADDPDAYGDAYDIGLGARYPFAAAWSLRGEWMMRRQSFTLWEVDLDARELVSTPVELWGRAFRVGVSREF